MRRALATALLLLSGCVTASSTAAAQSSVLLEPPDENCVSLGPMAVRMWNDLVMSEDALLSSAVNELRRRAAVRGATHLVVARPSSPATVAYGTTAAASGVAYRCREWP
jgi:hypothetical protein